MKIKQTVMVDCNFYIGDKNCFASATEVTVPPVKYKKTETSSISSIGTLKLSTGKIEALESKVKLSGFSSEVYEEIADPYSSVDVTVYGDLAVFEGNELTSHKPAVLYLTCSTSEFKPLGDKKEHDNIEQEITLDVSAFEFQVDGKTLHKVDVPNNILIVNGKDLRSAINANLGLN
mgnify:CR=1 FL=1